MEVCGPLILESASGIAIYISRSLQDDTFLRSCESFQTLLDPRECPNKFLRKDAYQATHGSLVAGFTVERRGDLKANSPTSSFLLTNGSLIIALEVTLTTAAADLFERIKGSLAAGHRVSIISPHPESLKTLAESVHAGLSLEDAMKVGYFTPEEFSMELTRLAQTVKMTRRK